MNELPAGHRKANCPSCGAEVVFSSSVSVFAVCGHCRTMMVRHDMDLESLGVMAQLPDDVSPVQVGSRGRHAKGRFEVIGRLKVAWSEGFWNEWFLRFEDGRHGWLGEAMGMFMLSIEEPKTGKVPALAKLKPDQEHEIVDGKRFSVDDIRGTECIGSEGQLPFKGLVGRKATSVDLSNNFGEFANIEYSAEDGIRLYLGQYVQFEALDWTNLRDLSRDLKKVQSAEQFKCPSCGGPVSLRTPGITASVACPYCGSTIDATNRNLAVLQKADKKMKIKPLIPPGTKGSLFGTAWEVTGFLRRADGSGAYEWDEYLLFNPYRGFRWLTTANGHWNFVEVLRGRPVADEASRTIVYQHREFRQFLAGKAQIRYVLGEFYWRVRTGQSVGVADYIDPPEILSRESDKQEAVWSLGHYVEPEAVKEGFKLAAEMPARSGVAPNQPSPVGKKLVPVLWVFAALAVLLTVLEIAAARRALDLSVFSETFELDPSVPQKAFSTRSFVLPKDVANLQVRFQTPVSNDWMEASFSLVDDATQNSVDFELGAEYYFGTDSDGAWSEGSGGSDIILSSVPGGTYHLTVHPAPSSPRTPVRNFSVNVLRDVSHVCNYFAALILLALYPAGVWIRHRSFEQRRWADSDFSPYASSDDE